MNWLRQNLARLVQMRRRWLGLLIGCILWVFFMWFGFWTTLLLVILAAAGYAVGRIFEADQSWKTVVDKLLSERFTDN